MGDSLFDIFGDVTKSAMKNVGRQTLSSIENMGKSVSGPLKPTDLPSMPLKKTELIAKRSFLSNKRQAVLSTPIRQISTPGVKVETLIYNDDADQEEITAFDMEFTRPSYKYDNFNTDMFDYLPLPEMKIPTMITPPNTPPPAICKPTIDFNCSYQDEFFTDDFSIDSLPELDLKLPDFF